MTEVRSDEPAVTIKAKSPSDAKPDGKQPGAYTGGKDAATGGDTQ